MDVNGTPAVIVDFETPDGLRGQRLALVHQGRIGFGVFIYAPADVYQDLEAIVEYVFGTFRLSEPE